MHTLHHIVGVGTLHGGDVDHRFAYRAGGYESTQWVESYGYALTDEFGQALGDLLQYALNDVVGVDTAVLGHVVGEAPQGKGLLQVHFGIVLTKSRVFGILVLAQVDSEFDVVCSHVVVMFLMISATKCGQLHRVAASRYLVYR